MKLWREVEVRDPREAAWWRVIALIWTIVMATATIAAVSCLGGCGPRPPVKVVTVERSCLDASRAVPSRPQVAFAGPDEGCPAQWETCLKREDAARLVAYLLDLERWANSAWIECATPKESP